MTDEEARNIVARLANGEESQRRNLVDQLYDGLANDVFRYLRMLVAYRWDRWWLAEEVLAGTFVAVWRGEGDYPDDEASVKAWLFGIARRLARDARRGVGLALAPEPSTWSPRSTVGPRCQTVKFPAWVALRAAS